MSEGRYVVDEASVEAWLRNVEIPTAEYVIYFCPTVEQSDLKRQPLESVACAVEVLRVVSRMIVTLNMNIACTLYLPMEETEAAADVPDISSLEDVLLYLDVLPPKIGLRRLDESFFAYYGKIERLARIDPAVVLRPLVSSDDSLAALYLRVHSTWTHGLGPAVLRYVLVGDSTLYDRFLATCIGKHDLPRMNEFLTTGLE